MADFILGHPGEQWASYRRRCLAFWREHYGDAIVAKVRAIIKKRIGAKGAV